MGLFNVNMPMIYGGDERGDRTFLRLQEEIMKDSDDESLFAWRDHTASDTSTMGLLATHPSMFECSGEYFSYQDWEPRTPFSKTNRGLQISLPLRPVEKDLYVAALNCPMPGNAYGFLGIYLKRLTHFDDSKFENQYARTQIKELLGIDNAERRGQVQTLYVRQATNASGLVTTYPEHVVQLRRVVTPSPAYELFGSMGEESTTRLPIKVGASVPGGLPTAFRIAKAQNQLAGVFVFERGFQNRFAVLVGSCTARGDLGVAVLESYDSQTFRTLEPSYIPCQPGSDIDTGRELVRVSVQAKIDSAIKYYIIDIKIERNPTFKDYLLSQTPIGDIASIVPEVKNAVANPDDNARRWSPHAKTKLHNIFKSKSST